MKIINTILSIIFLLLSCVPCADEELSSVSYTSQAKSSTNDKHSHDTTDACSPFCVCSCCGNQVFVYYTHYDFSSFRDIIDTKVPEYQSVIASSYFGSIWQPPQLNS